MRSTLPGKALCILLAGLWLLGAGVPAPAQSPPATAPAKSPAATGSRLVIHVPGIGGYLPIDRRFIAALRQAGIDGPIEHFDWTNNDPGLRALVNTANKQAQARRLAELLTERYRDHPDQPISITCHSGGGAIVVWALEQLPEDVRIERLLLLAPALSPSYDLSNALRRVRDRAWVFYSDLDPVLGAGTRMLGTMDGVRADAMGRVGIQVPDTADKAQYAKLIAMPYRDEWVRYDNIGDHIGALAPPFVEAVIAPLITGDRP